MALASTCPHCRTSFRVVADQLKLQRGLVRCGRCGRTFSGIDHLRYIDDAQLRSPAERAPVAGQTDAPAPPAGSGGEPPAAGPDTEKEAVRNEDRSDPPDSDGHALDPQRREEPDHALPVAAPEQPDDEAGEHRSADHETADRVAVPDEAVTGDAAVDDLATGREPGPQALRTGFDQAPACETDGVETDTREAEAWTEALPEDSAIDYFSTRRARGFADRQSLLASLLAIVLTATLAGQWTITQRDWIAVRIPALAPALGTALAPFGLTIGAPRQLEALTIESFELHTATVPGLLEMHALLHNRAAHPVRWPTMQVTLTDPTGRNSVSRSLEPSDYLGGDPAQPAGSLPAGVPAAVPARTEWPLHLALRAPDLPLSGYDYQVRLAYHR